MISAAPMSGVVAGDGAFSKFCCRVTLDAVVVILIDDVIVLAM